MNNNVIRIIDIEIENIKNVSKGNISFDDIKDDDLKSDIIAIYGQNGSGKTAIIDSINILKQTMSGLKVNKNVINYINKNVITAGLKFKFQINNYIVNYHFDIKNIDNSYPVISYEYLSYLNDNGEDNVIIESFNDDLSNNSYNNSIKLDDFDLNKLNTLKSKLYLNRKSFIFNSTILNIISKHNNKLLNIIKILKHYSKNNLYIIEMSNYSLNNTKLIPIPLSDTLGSKQVILKTGLINVLKSDLSDFNKIINQLSYLTSTIIPNMKIEFITSNDYINKNNEEVITGELYSIKNDVAIKLAYESEGIKKIVSILSALIAVYNNESYFVAIDELDSSIFEYLLGELLSVFSSSGKGQLLFTSHNLRVLEVIPKEGIYFSTINPNNKFIKFTNLDNNNNLRNAYLRAIQLGGTIETIYEDTNKYDIIRALRLKGKNDGK